MFCTRLAPHAETQQTEMNIKYRSEKDNEPDNVHCFGDQEDPGGSLDPGHENCFFGPVKKLNVITKAPALLPPSYTRMRFLSAS